MSPTENIARFTWDLKMETPLCCRSGTQGTWTQNNSNKKARLRPGRARRTQDKETGWAGFADLYHEVRLDNGQVVVEYGLPPSAVRGAVRSWSITHLADRAMWGCTDIPKGDEGREEYLRQLRVALARPDSGWPYLRSVFGMATDHDEDGLSMAGRIQFISCRISAPEGLPQPCAADEAGLARTIRTRGPVCRVTQGARVGGLHSFLEWPAGTRLRVEFSIRNPKKADLGLALLWQRNISSGSLRFGALSSIGMGRASIQIKSSSRVVFGARKPDWMMDTDAGAELDAAEPLAGLWKRWCVPWESADREAYIAALKTKLGRS